MSVATLQDVFGRWSRGAIVALLIAVTAPATGIAAEVEVWSFEMRQGDTLSALPSAISRTPMTG